jgi:heptosyltransferase-2
VTEPKKILVIVPNWVGDVVMATPAFRSLRLSFPEAEITYLARPYVTGILHGAPWFDRLIPYDRRKGSLRDAVRLIRGFRSEEFDLALVFPNSFSTALLAKLGGAREKIGYVKDRRGFLLTKAIPRPGEGPGEGGEFQPVYMADYYLELVAAAGARPHGTQLQLFVPEDTEKRAAELLQKLGAKNGDTLVGLNPGAAYGSSKCWMPERFAEVGDRLAADFGARCLILAGPGEDPVQEEIASRMRSAPMTPAPRDLTLDVLKGVVKRITLLVTNDTGPRHFASAFDIPSVVLMGPTDPRYTRSPSERAVVLRQEVDCGPCHLKTCPEDHRCMTSLTVDMVLDAAHRLLGDAKPGN